MLTWTAGPANAVFAVAVPLAVGNFILMSYIATNHFMRPQTSTNETLDNSMGVTTLPVLDWFHHHFSHHIEHHLFPRMPGPGAPLVRTWLREKQGHRYVAPPHWRAVTHLYRTPRVYLDANTLINPLTDETLRVSEITRRFGYDPLQD